MITIHKYPLKFGYTSEIVIEMPVGANILSLENQNGIPVLYAKVDTKAPLVDYTIYYYLTGEELPDLYDKTFINTLMLDNGFSVFHFYIQRNKKDKP